MMKLESKLDCEQPNCEQKAIGFIYFHGAEVLMLLCHEHENQVARMEGEMELEEFRFGDPDWGAKMVTFLNGRTNWRATKYSNLLRQYDELKKLVNKETRET